MERVSYNIYGSVSHDGGILQRMMVDDSHNPLGIDGRVHLGHLLVVYQTDPSIRLQEKNINNTTGGCRVHASCLSVVGQRVRNQPLNSHL